ncbi:MAG: hypothetical protein CSA35_07465 [Dethiosulfovibrio peptidovorans]|nr:MAG: hypothetical protein CSA35_07465 [Dethiosulfovibrio peptidovorans]
MAIGEGSPARDAGTVSADILSAGVISLISMDQRGEIRDPQDTPDVGAYEYKGSGPAPAPGGGGGGCSVGFAPAILFLALPLVFMRR